MDRPPLFDDLHMETGRFTLSELKESINTLRPNKAAGIDGHPLEYWRAVVGNTINGMTEGAEWLLELCNQAWMGKKVPAAWHLQRVMLIYKKGDPADCANYRPICLFELRLQNLRYDAFETAAASRGRRTGVAFSVRFQEEQKG